MQHLDLLAQMYLVSFFVGSFFIVCNIILGQIGHLGPGHNGIADHGLSHDNGLAGQSGHDTAIGHSTASHNLTAQAEINQQSWLGSYVAAGILANLRRRLSYLVSGDDASTRIGMTLIAWLSPMRIAIWLTFFGLSGFFIERLFPWLFVLSLLPALLIAIIASTIFNNLITWTINSLQSPEVSGRTDIIGSVAEVCTPMKDNQIGEIIYKLDSGRTNSAAKIAKPGLEINRGTKVIIVGMENHIALVEPITDSFLLEDIK